MKVSKRAERLGAFLLIVLLGIVGFWRLEQVNERQCVTDAVNRAALRQLVNDIADQAETAIRSGSSNDQREAELIAQFEGYRVERLKGLSETHDCRHQTYKEIEAEVQRGVATGAP